MNVLVNETTLNVKNAYAERDEATGIITYYIILSQSEMDYTELKALFKGNSEEIVKTDDNGNVELFAVAEYEHIIDDDTNGLYTVILKTNENKHQLAKNRQLEADKASLESTVASKDNEISTLTTSITEKDGTITEQVEKIVELEATIVSKDEEITAKDAEIAELLTIAEEYADLVFASLEESDIEDLESEVM